jgi:hypothetical protein
LANSISQMSYSTVTAAAHPMTFWPLATLDPTATPIIYTLPLTASKVPPGPYHSEVDAAAVPSAYVTQAIAAPSINASASDSIPVCTLIKGSYPESTLPAFCRPTLFVNAPALASPTGTQVALATAAVTMSANSVPDKVNCCAECANYYNCYAWRFVPSYEGHPSERLPGGFDPFRHGNCEIAYYTGNTTSDGVTIEDAPSVCPNGRLQYMLNGTNNIKGQDSWIAGLYYNGWNDGACGNEGKIIFQRGRDKGYSDKSICEGPLVLI